MNKNLNTCAEIVLDHGQFKIIKNGDHVKCSISGKKIALKDLKYWNVELQEIYFGPDIAFKRYKEINDL